mmetsp:Transcript_56642/g.100981  ORF Transcript_56642/g.100981 Transcript_56642/m.100981 type:complete len:137 (-) Transcript_56642:690-1100(-)
MCDPPGVGRDQMDPGTPARLIENNTLISWVLIPSETCFPNPSETYLAAACGCYFKKMLWGPSGPETTNVLNSMMDVPSIVIKDVPPGSTVLQGCCQLPMQMQPQEWREGTASTDDRWGVCADGAADLHLMTLFQWP